MTGNIKYQGIFENVDVLMIILLTGGFMIQGAVEEMLWRGNDLWCNWCHKSNSYFRYFFISHNLF
jgi:hypothetical protein